MWNLPDIHLKIINEVFAGSKADHLFRVVLQLHLNPLNGEQSREHENICKCILYNLSEPALLPICYY